MPLVVLPSTFAGLVAAGERATNFASGPVRSTTAAKPGEIHDTSIVTEATASPEPRHRRRDKQSFLDRGG